MILGPILAALMPFAGEALSGIFKGITRRITGDTGYKPQSVAEVVQLAQVEIERTKTLAQLDQPASNISTWVADLRASFRYLAAGLILLINGSLLVVSHVTNQPLDPGIQTWVTESTLDVFGFMFGDRVRIGINGKA